MSKKRKRKKPKNRNPNATALVNPIFRNRVKPNKQKEPPKVEDYDS